MIWGILPSIQIRKDTKIKRFTIRGGEFWGKKPEGMAGQTFADTSENSKRSEYSVTQKVL